MSDATAINANNPALLSEAQVDSTSDLTSEDADFDKRVEAARIRVSRLLEEARKPLAAPCVLFTGLMAEERADRADALEWTGWYEKREQVIERVEGINRRLSEDIVNAADGGAAEQGIIRTCFSRFNR